MPIYDIDPEHLSIEVDTARAAAAPFAEEYQSGKPYNHICIDNFLPEEVLRGVQADLRSLQTTKDSNTFERAQENLKTQYNPDRLPRYSRDLFHALNSRPILVVSRGNDRDQGPDPRSLLHRCRYSPGQ